MVHQIEALVPEQLQLRIVLREKTDIVVGRRQHDAPGLGGVHLGKGLLHVRNRVRVFQLFAQLDHVMVHLPGGEAGRRLFGTFHFMAGRKEKERD